MISGGPLGGRWLSSPTGRALLAALGVLYVLSLTRDPGLSGRLWLALALSALQLGAWLAALWRFHWALIVPLVLGALVTEWVAPHSVGSAGLYVAVTMLVVNLRTVPALLLSGVVAAGGLGVQVLRLPGTDPQGLGFQLLTFALTVAATWIGRRSRDQLAAANQPRVEGARGDERARVAPELHDVLAHSLSALAVQLDLARMLLQRRPDDPAALAAVERAHALARQGLDDARQAVSALRGDQLPGPGQLLELAIDFERDTGVPCAVEIAADLPTLSSEEAVTLYRAAQEALTNVRKHAAARQVRLRLAAAEGGVRLVVENDGEGKPSLAAAGYGLVGMRERAELAGGTTYK